MSAYYGTARRMGSSAAGAAAWAPNRNSVRHNAKISLGPAARLIILGVLVVIIGLFSVAQSASVTSYDMAIANIDNEITNPTKPLTIESGSIYDRTYSAVWSCVT